MTLPANILSSIQKVGAAAYEANTNLKQYLNGYSTTVSASIVNGPDSPSSETLLSNLRSIARLAQSLGQIEEDLRAIFESASKIAASDEMASTKSKSVPRKSKKVRTKQLKSVAKADRVRSPSKLKGNGAKLLEHLQSLLNANDFVTVKQTDIASALGIPKGSIGASFKRLIDSKLIEVSADGGLKLVQSSTN